MNPEDRLDFFIDAGYLPQDPIPAETDLFDEIAVAQMLQNIHTISVPQDLIDRVDMRVRTLAEQMQQEQPTRAIPSIRSNTYRRRRLIIAVGGIAAALIVSFMGITYAAADSIPGDPLYGIKQLQQQVVLASAGSTQNTVNIAASQLRASVDDFTAAVNQHRSLSDLLDGLQNIENNTQQLQNAAKQLPPTDSAQTTSQDALHYEVLTLSNLLQKNIPWQIRLAMSKNLQQLGRPVVTISSAAVNMHDSQIVITVTGTHFISGTRITLNGQIMPQTDRIFNSATIVAAITRQNVPIGNMYIGVQNPDGTADQLAQSSSEHDDANATPESTRTPDAQGTPAGQETPEPQSTHEPTQVPPFPSPTEQSNDSNKMPTPMGTPQSGH